MITLKLGSVDILPPGNIFALEGRGTSSTKTENDIYGNQVASIPEIKTANQLWSITAAYVDLSTTQATISAYEQHNQLVFTDEAGSVFNVVVTEYPTIERHKIVGGNLSYTVKLVLGMAPTAWGIPIISLTGPRQFGR